MASLFERMSWSTVSKAFDKSRKRAEQFSLQSMALIISKHPKCALLVCLRDQVWETLKNIRICFFQQRFYMLCFYVTVKTWLKSCERELSLAFLWILICLFLFSYFLSFYLCYLLSCQIFVLLPLIIWCSFSSWRNMACALNQGWRTFHQDLQCGHRGLNYCTTTGFNRTSTII